LNPIIEAISVAFGLDARYLTIGLQFKSCLDKALSFALEVSLEVEELQVVDEAQGNHKFLGFRIEHV